MVHSRPIARRKSVLSRPLTILSIAAGVLLVSPLHASTDDCDGLDYEGRCDGHLVRWCEDGRVRVTDCSEQGTTCEHDPERGYYACVSPERAGETGCPDGLTWHGRCEGERVVVWCEQGTERSMTCAEGTHCGWSDEGTYDCLVEGDGGAQGFAPGGEGGNGSGGAASEPDPADPAEPAPKSSGGAPPTPSGPGTSGGPVDEPAPGGEGGSAPGTTEPAFGCGATAPTPSGLLSVLAVLALAAWPRRRAR
jgi:hypothetical protein